MTSTLHLDTQHLLPRASLMPAVNFRLLLVTDRQQTGGRPLLDVLRSALAAGVRAIQLRERDLSSRDLLRLAQDVQRLTIVAGGQLLINDRVDVAMTLDNVGVHLRANSLPVAVARKLLGGQRLIGISAHSVDDVVRAEAEGADYVVLGPIYETPSKTIYGAPLGVSTCPRAGDRHRWSDGDACARGPTRGCVRCRGRDGRARCS